MPYSRSQCPTPGCPEITAGGRCARCTAQAEAHRGTAAQRGYSRGHRAFRTAVLTRDPICVLCRSAPSTEADHYPRSRRELLELGLDPSDPRYGRGLCESCHKTETAARQPGGWHAEQ